MVDVAFVTLDSLAIFLVIVPMPWHLSAWNSATCYMMLWTMIGCLVHLVNTIVWADSLANPAPIWCDISTKLIIGLSIAIPLSSLCINRRLYNIATMQTVAVTKQMKKRAIIIDTILAVLCPMIFMAVHYTMQGHRYDILENYGCWPSTYHTAPAYVLVIVPPILVCAVSLVICTLTLRAFIKRRSDFNELLRSSSTGLTSTRYFRLMALASAEILIGLPVSLYFLITNLMYSGVRPWISWEDTHADFGHVNYYPKYYFRINKLITVSCEFNRWAFPFIAFLFFAFFGFAEEARRNYKLAIFAVLKPFGIRPKPAKANPGQSSSFGKFSDKFGGQTPPHSAVMVSFKRETSLGPAPVKAPAPEPSEGDLDATLPTLDMSALEGYEKLFEPSSSAADSASHASRTHADIDLRHSFPNQHPRGDDIV